MAGKGAPCSAVLGRRLRPRSWIISGKKFCASPPPPPAPEGQLCGPGRNRGAGCGPERVPSALRPRGLCRRLASGRCPRSRAGGRGSPAPRVHAGGRAAFQFAEPPRAGFCGVRTFLARANASRAVQGWEGGGGQAPGGGPRPGGPCSAPELVFKCPSGTVQHGITFCCPGLFFFQPTSFPVGVENTPCFSWKCGFNIFAAKTAQIGGGLGRSLFPYFIRIFLQMSSSFSGRPTTLLENITPLSPTLPTGFLVL